VNSHQQPKGRIAILPFGNPIAKGRREAACLEKLLCCCCVYEDDFDGTVSENSTVGKYKVEWMECLVNSNLMQFATAITKIFRRVSGEEMITCSFKHNLVAGRLTGYICLSLNIDGFYSTIQRNQVIMAFLNAGFMPVEIGNGKVGKGVGKRNFYFAVPEKVLNGNTPNEFLENLRRIKSGEMPKGDKTVLDENYLCQLGIDEGLRIDILNVLGIHYLTSELPCSLVAAASS